jgi:uncharacterized membrane protein YhaH (DUF805 family)
VSRPLVESRKRRCHRRREVALQGRRIVQKLLFSFEGRINRAKFWLVLLGVAAVEVIVLSATGGSAYLTAADPAMVMQSMSSTGYIPLIIFIPLFWIGLAANVKRWHDRDKSGWWVLINLVPVIGGLWSLIETGFLPGTRGSNRFGPDPLQLL